MDNKTRGRKILLYYNPYSGNGMFKNNLDLIIDKCQKAKYQVVPIRATKRPVLDKCLSGIDQSEFSRILAAGGDGTVNMCINAMMKNDIHIPLALLPAGTANDFAYYFDLPSDIHYLMDVALGDRTTKADVGIANNQYFVNVAALGNLVDVSQKTNPNLKSALGMAAYYLRALSELPQIKSLHVTLTTPDKVYDEEILFMMVINGESAGGFRKLSPEAAIDDGKLEVMAFRKATIPELVALLFAVNNGNHLGDKHVLYFQTEDLTIESPDEITTDIDGEAGEKLPLHFSTMKQRLEVLVPQDWEGK